MYSVFLPSPAERTSEDSLSPLLILHRSWERPFYSAWNSPGGSSQHCTGLSHYLAVGGNCRYPAPGGGVLWKKRPSIVWWSLQQRFSGLGELILPAACWCVCAGRGWHHACQEARCVSSVLCATMVEAVMISTLPPPFMSADKLSTAVSRAGMYVAGQAVISGHSWL